MAVMMPYKFSSLYSELEVPRQRRPSIRLPSFWNIWNSRPCFKAKFSAAFDSFISDRRTFSPFWWWDKSFWQIIWQFDKFRFKMEEKRARLFKLISGKGGQPSAERLKIQKDLFGFSRVSQTFMIRCLSDAHFEWCFHLSIPGYCFQFWLVTLTKHSKATLFCFH